MTQDRILQFIGEVGVVAIIRAPSGDRLPEIFQALVEGGVTAIEVTLTTPKAMEGIALLSKRFGDRACVGVGTVLDEKACRDAIAAGAQFVVSPTYNQSVVDATRSLGKVSIPGAFTPNEIYHAYQHGAHVVKVFPASSLGPTYFKDLLAPMPFLKLAPTGGVDAKNAGAWIKAGAVCVGAGSSLVTKEAMAQGDWATITANAAVFVASVKAAR